MTSARQTVSDGARLGAWFILIVLWLGSVGMLVLEKPTAYALAAAALIAAAGTAVFLPIARGSASDHWFLDFLALGGVLYLSNRLEVALSGPWWWYVAALVVCLGFARVLPLRARLSRIALLAALAVLIGVGVQLWHWEGTGYDLYDRVMIPAWVLSTLLGITVAVHSRLSSSPSDTASPA